MKDYFDPLKKKHLYCPIRFLQDKKEEILLKLTQNYKYPDSESSDFFNMLILMISKIKELRNYPVETVRYLSGNLISLPYPLQILFSTYILKSITSEKTYRDAINFIINFYSSDFPYPLPFIVLSDHDLKISLEEEKEELADILPVSKSFLTFSCNLSEANLIQLCQRMIKRHIIDYIPEPDFIYLFSSNLLHPHMTPLHWRESRSLCHEFLSRVVFIHSKFNYKQVNACIKFPDEQNLNSSFQNKSFYKKDDILNGLLDFGH
jgi:hypothetical protein